MFLIKADGRRYAELTGRSSARHEWGKMASYICIIHLVQVLWTHSSDTESLYLVSRP